MQNGSFEPLKVILRGGQKDNFGSTRKIPLINNKVNAAVQNESSKHSAMPQTIHQIVLVEKFGLSIFFTTNTCKVDRKESTAERYVFSQ